MENKRKLKLLLIAIASVSAMSVLIVRRRSRRQKCPRSSCYLRDCPKPQCSFKRLLPDNSYSAFKHLNHIPSSKSVGAGNESNSHPFEAEISKLLKRPKLELNFPSDDANLEMIESYIWVETESQLKDLAAVLSGEKVFAVDTEQHSLRSFLGFTALVQISTRKEDYLVDTIALHDSMGHLCPVFADHGICKVFHGADNDVLWLQRDFHIYVVNLFDTAKACEVLLKPQKSLAYLLETYCGVITNKLLQREDWRQRPLSDEMVNYARTDAHYLLYIANCLIAEMEQVATENSSLDDKFRFVLEASRRSNMICFQLYTKEFETFPGESAALSIFSRYLNGQAGISSASCQFQDRVRQLCAWRDLMARVHDESLRYVLSEQAIIALAHEAPTTLKDICSTIAQADCNVDSNFTSILPSPSLVVISHLDDICYLLQEKMDNLDDIFPMLLQKCLGSSGSCPLSISNYALLLNCDLKLTSVTKQNAIKNPKQVTKKASRELFVQKFSCKSPVYHNCRIYANDGRLLCYCDQKKLEWYLRRDLAKIVDENPPAIMLLFEPKGRPEDEDNDFYIQSKKNICVGCGEGKHYLRYRIIPSCYRMHFPEHLKSHRSHDIVLLCVDCHEVAHAAAEKHKRKVAEEFGIPLFVRKVVDSEEVHILSGSSESAKDNELGVSPLQLRTAAMALLRHGPRMPSNRREELIEIVARYYGRKEISEEDLERALLVGMSPHERRRFARKKGLSLKRSQGSFLPDAEQESSTDCITTSAMIDTLNDSNTKTESCSRKKYGDFVVVKDSNLASSSLCSDSGVVANPALVQNKNSDRNGVSAASIINLDDDCENRSSPNGEVEYWYRGSNGIAPPKHKSKLSLLGHGPHGKQVVDHLLKEYGDDGIRQFCQRWRQIFVEALSPRFLPVGWDIMHSGRRDFGEFSVYKPSH